ncbi:MAG: lysine transporter LysE [Flavobacterium sp.]|nr:lysine transporter LysE [Flavobacterium sp.]
MDFSLPLILGFAIAAIGVLPPGLINMTAAKVSIVDGRNEAISFAIGATVIVLFQTYIAIQFAKFIYSRQDIITLLQEIGLFLFLAITLFLFWTASKPKKIKQEIKLHSKSNRFFLGMLLSGLNLFPIPFYVFVSVTLSSFGLFYFNSLTVYSFVSGVGMGSFTVFYWYILYFKNHQSKSDYLIKNGNYIIGSITGIISLITFFKLITTNWT